MRNIFTKVSYVTFFVNYQYNMKRQSQSGKRTLRLVHVDTTQLDLNQDFQLSIVPPPNACSSDEPIYKLKQVKDPSHTHKVESLVKPVGPSDCSYL